MSLLLSIGFVLLAAPGPTDIDAHVTLEPPIIPYHKQAKYTISVEAPAGLNVRLPEMINKFGGLGLAGAPQRKQETLSGDRVRISDTYTIDPIVIGDYFIAAAAIYSNDAVALTVPSPALRVRDLTPEEKTAAEQFDPIAGPIDPKNPLLRPRVIAVALGSLAVAMAGWLVYRRWRRPKSVPAPPPLPAWETAYQRLRVLDAQRLPHTGQYEPYYVELSGILRHYIEDRFSLHAPERTTPEFLAEASGSGALTDEHQQLLAGFLKHSDRVKFAKFEPSVAEMDHSMSLVLHFIDETVPKPVAPQEEAA